MPQDWIWSQGVSKGEAISGLCPEEARAVPPLSPSPSGRHEDEVGVSCDLCRRARLRDSRATELKVLCFLHHGVAGNLGHLKGLSPERKKHLSCLHD